MSSNKEMRLAYEASMATRKPIVCYKCSVCQKFDLEKRIEKIKISKKKFYYICLDCKRKAGGNEWT